MSWLVSCLDTCLSLRKISRLGDLLSLKTVITFRVSRRRREMYVGHSRQCVCLCAAACPHYCTDPNVTWGNGRGCPLVVQYWADFQLVHGFRCCDNIAPNVECQGVLVYSLYAWFRSVLISLFAVGLHLSLINCAINCYQRNVGRKFI